MLPFATSFTGLSDATDTDDGLTNTPSRTEVIGVFSVCFGEQLDECSVVYVLVRRRSNEGEGTLGVDELIGDRVVELRVVGLITCEGVRIVIGDEAPLGEVAQVVLHGVPVVEVSLQVREHEEGEKEKDGEVQVEVKGEVEENQGETLIMDGMEMTVKDSRTT